jgi:5-azacytidine-induced protein 1
MKRVKNTSEEDVEILRAKQRCDILEIEKKLKEEKDSDVQKRSEEIKKSFEQKLDKIKSQMTKERDSQIEKIVNKISEENMEKSMAIRGRIDSKVSSVTKAHQQELQDYRKENLILRNKAETHQKNLAEGEAKCAEFDLKISEFETTISTKNEKIAQLTLSLKNLQNEIIALGQTITQNDKNLQENVKNDQAQRDQIYSEFRQKETLIRKDCQDEVKGVEDRHCVELGTFEDRVKKILRRKDEEIGRLREDVEVKEGLCRKYEELLEKQKRELFSEY